MMAVVELISSKKERLTIKSQPLKWMPEVKKQMAQKRYSKAEALGGPS